MEIQKQRKREEEEEEEEEEERRFVALWHPSDDYGDDGDGDEIWPLELDPQIWKKLDLHVLMDGIFCHLPFFSVLRFRAVSQGFNTHLLSRAFWLAWYKKNPNPNSIPKLLLLSTYTCASDNDSDHQHHHHHGDPIWTGCFSTKSIKKKVCLWKKNKSIAFVPSSKTPLSPSSWPQQRKWPWLSLLPREPRWFDLPKSFFVKPLGICRVLCSGGGLFVVTCKSKTKCGAHEFRFFIYNLINKSSLKLPKLKNISLEEEFVPYRSFIIVDNHDNLEEQEQGQEQEQGGEEHVGHGYSAFRVVFAVTTHLFSPLQVYFSGTRVWKELEVHDDMDRLLPPPSDAILVCHEPLTLLNNNMLVWYEKERNRLAIRPFVGIPENAIFPIVSLFWKDPDTCWSTIFFLDMSFVIYKWNVSSCKWVWTQSLPEEANREFMMSGGKLFSCAKIRDCLFLLVRGCNRVLIYHLGSMEWMWSPMSPFTQLRLNLISSFTPRPLLEVAR